MIDDIRVRDRVRWRGRPNDRGVVVRVTRDGLNAQVVTESFGTKFQQWVRIQDLELDWNDEDRRPSVGF